MKTFPLTKKEIIHQLAYRIGDVLLLDNHGNEDASKSEMLRRILAITENCLKSLKMKDYVKQKLENDIINSNFSNYNSVYVRDKALQTIKEIYNKM